MIIKKLIGENLYSFPEISLEFKSGLFLILGENKDSPVASSNYSGKSNIFEALLWILYGRGTKETKPDGSSYSGASKEQVIHKGASEAKGTVILESEGEEYSITRTRTKRGGDLIITIGGKPISGKSISETQQIVDSILGMSYDTFLQAVFFAQGTKRFTQSKDSEIKEMFGEVLGFSILENAQNKLKEILKNRKTEIVKIEHQKSYKMAELKGLEQAKLIADSANQKFEEELAEWNAKVLDLKKQIILLGNDLLAGNETFQTAFDAESLRLSLLSKNAETLANSILVNDSKAASIRKAIKGGICSVCKQPVGVEVLEELVSEHDTSSDVIEHTKLLAEIKESTQRIDRIKEAIALVKMLNDIREKEPKNTVDASVYANIEKLKNEITLLGNQIELFSDQLKTYELLVEAFGDRGIKSILLDDVLPLLNERVHEYGCSLLGNRTRISFDTESLLASGDRRDKFSVNVETEGGFGYHLCSGGERRRVDFAVALALQSLLPSTNLFICDEPFESLDEPGQFAIIELLRKRIEENPELGIYVITHIPQLQDMFDNSILVRKENGKSKIS